MVNILRIIKIKNKIFWIFLEKMDWNQYLNIFNSVRSKKLTDKLNLFFSVKLKLFFTFEIDFINFFL